MIWQPGDLLFFWGRSDFVSRMISRYTFGPSHVGIVVDFKWRGLRGNLTETLLAESTTLIKGSPCRIRGVLWAGVQAQYVSQRINAYVNNGGRAELWRLQKQWTPDQLDRLSTYAYETTIRGTEYDYRYAILGGTWRLQLYGKMFGIGAPDPSKQYCSEYAGNCLREADHGSDQWNTNLLTPSGMYDWTWWKGNGEKVKEWGAR